MSKALLTNPFDDDSDDESDDDFNPFKSKKNKIIVPPPELKPEPEPIQVPAPLVSKANATAKPKTTKAKPKSNGFSSNPFENDDEDDIFKSKNKESTSVKPKSVRPALKKKPSFLDSKLKNENFDFNDAGTNPFAGEDTEDVFAASKPTTQKSRHLRSKTTASIDMNTVLTQNNMDMSKSTSKNPKSSKKFDFDADFDDNNKDLPKPVVKKSLLERFKSDGNNNKNEGLTPIISTMDQDDTLISKSQHGARGRVKNNVEFAGVKKSQRPSNIGNQNRSKTESSIVQGIKSKSSNQEPSQGWFRGSAKVAAAGAAVEPASNRTPKRNKNKTGNNKSSSKNGKTYTSKKTTKRNPLVQCWPYDDYHKDQEKYYESVKERDGPMGVGNDWTPRSRKKRVGDPGQNGQSDDKLKTPRSQQNKFTNENMFDRPADLPSIKEAVQNLSLFEFENTAEKRAISIVSTWLFDAGLIDELLINGANTFRTPMSISSGASISLGSVRSSEGVEVGAHGFPLEGGLKIDKETEKLRTSTQRELTLINTRLNDGVAASGSEVQELVNAVAATKNELGRLRELVTYISSGYKKDEGNAGNDSKDRLILSDYPRLKDAINARRNIFRCFRELEFFSQIPMTCDRLRDELHQGEWTDNEWNSIRNVCMEHVELEILLVTAEAGMKKWLNDEDDDDDDSSMPSIVSNKSLRKTWKGNNQMGSLGVKDNHHVVDNFLRQHVKNVWELGNEIRMRILSGVGSAFDLALQNPAGMVALVEAVEVYERAADEYKASQPGDDDSVGSDNNHLRFTHMRSAALSQLYDDFRGRGIEIFRAIQNQAADLADEDDALNSQFNAVLRAATELVTEIDVVKNQMAPCFAPHWHVEMLWSTCVAHICSIQIIQQIGGLEGNNLPDLTVTQLLDLVAWVEFFRETIEDAFPSVGAIQATKKSYFEETPDLFAGNDKRVNMDNAKDSLAWANNMLWDVHRLARDEFLDRTRVQTEEWITKVYNTNHETTQTKEGRLVTSLCEDIFSLAGVQLRTIRERLTRKSDALVMAVRFIFGKLRAKQIASKDKFLSDLESCCAAANDFQRMSEQVEDMVQEIIDHSELPEHLVELLEEDCGTLVSLYSSDAVYAAQKVHCFIFEPIWEAISIDLFGPKWEMELTHNELAMTLIRTLDDFMGDLETFLDEFMLKKTVDALVASTVVFYVKCLLLKAENHNNNKVPYFNDSSKALARMDGDIKIMRDYFVELAEGMPALNKVIEKEFSVLETIQELIRIASGISDFEASDFILFLHKRLKDVHITKHVVGDLWHLVQPTEERTVWELTESLEESLLKVCPPLPSHQQKNQRSVPGLRLDETLAKLYIDSKRKRPVHATAVENMLAAMKNNWANADVES